MTAAAVVLLVVVSRAPLVTTALWAWDSVLYARSLDGGFHVGIDLADQRPHAPGYLFYVLAASVARAFVNDTNAALVLVSVLASGLAAAGLYLVARRFAGPFAAAVAALGFAAAPLAWTYGEVAMPYAVLALGSVVLAGAFAASRGDPARTVGASVALGLASGFRQDLLLVLGPLWLWLLAPLGWRARAAATLALALACVCWVAPSAIASGGLGAYVEALAAQGARVEAATPVAGGAGDLVRNLALTLFGLFWATLLVGMGLLVAGLARLRRVVVAPAAPFFALWIVPALLFYTAVHVGDPGYVLSVAPAIFVLFAAWIDRWPAPPRRAVAALVLAQGVLFLGGGVYPFSRDALTAHDQSVRDLLAATRALPADASLVASGPAYSIAAYYVRDRPVRFTGDAPEVLARGARAELPPSRRTTLVIFAPPSLRTATVEAGQAYPLPLYDLGLR